MAHVAVMIIDHAEADQGEEYAIFARVWHGDRIEHYEAVHKHKDGHLIDVSLTVSPARDAEGKILGCSKIARDIRERQRSEAQMSILAREPQHRAKNLLANVHAMVRLSQAETPRHLVKQEPSPYSKNGAKRAPRLLDQPSY